jgi:hypothetical protein
VENDLLNLPFLRINVVNDHIHKSALQGTFREWTKTIDEQANGYVIIVSKKPIVHQTSVDGTVKDVRFHRTALREWSTKPVLHLLSSQRVRQFAGNNAADTCHIHTSSRLIFR